MVTVSTIATIDIRDSEVVVTITALTVSIRSRSTEPITYPWQQVLVVIIIHSRSVTMTMHLVGRHTITIITIRVITILAHVERGPDGQPRPPGSRGTHIRPGLALLMPHPPFIWCQVSITLFCYVTKKYYDQAKVCFLF